MSRERTHIKSKHRNVSSTRGFTLFSKGTPWWSRSDELTAIVGKVHIERSIVNLNISRIKKQDIENLTSLFPLFQQYDYWKQDNFHFEVCNGQGDTIGLLTVLQDDNREVLYLSMVEILPEFQHQGILKQLTIWAIETFAQEDWTIWSCPIHGASKHVLYTLKDVYGDMYDWVL